MMRKNFRYALELDGVVHVLIQEIAPPKVGFAEVPHGSPGNIPNGKTPGKMAVGDLVLKKCRPEGVSDTWIWNWMAKCVGGLFPQYAKQAFLLELAPDAITPIDKFYLGNIWPKDLDHSGLKAEGGGENIIETLTFSVQFFYNVASPEFTALFGGSAAGAGGLAATLGRL